MHRWSTRRTQIERRWTLASVIPLFSPLSPIFREQADRQEDRLVERPGEALGGGISDEVFEGSLMIEEERGWEMVTVKTPNSSGSKGRGRKGLGVLRNQGHSRFTGFSRSPACSRRDCRAPSCGGDRRAVIYAFPPIVYSSKMWSSGRIVTASGDPREISLGGPKVPFCGSFLGTSPKLMSLQAFKETKGVRCK